ncbi:MAG: dihydroneopterin aldolase [Opitutales bacterium]|nr:dihydroneopterin aldolase [Opitutales bacterium]
MTDKIIIGGLKIYGYHGVLPEERENGQTFFVDLELALDLRRAGTSDDLGDTVNYAEICQKVKALTEAVPACFLIEALAEKIAALVLRDFAAVKTVLVRVHKPQAPVGVPVADVAVQILRSREG